MARGNGEQEGRGAAVGVAGVGALVKETKADAEVRCRWSALGVVGGVISGESALPLLSLRPATAAGKGTGNNGPGRLWRRRWLLLLLLLLLLGLRC